MSEMVAEQIGAGQYAVTMSVGDMTMKYSAPSKEEALQMAGMAVDPANAAWDVKVVQAGEDLDHHLFVEGWEPVSCQFRANKAGGQSAWWGLRRKVIEPPKGVRIEEGVSE